jgi:hypothetical protein
MISIYDLSTGGLEIRESAVETRRRKGPVSVHLWTTGPGSQCRVHMYVPCSRDWCPLVSLEFRGCSHLKTTGIRSVHRLPNLQSLTMTQCPTLTDTHLWSLGQLPHLQILDVSWNCSISDAGLESLGIHMPILRHLQLKGCRRMTDIFGFQRLNQTKDLPAFIY